MTDHFGDAAGTRLVVTTGDLVRHLQGNASGVPAERRSAVTTKLSEPIGVQAPRVERATQLLTQASKARRFARQSQQSTR